MITQRSETEWHGVRRNYKEFCFPLLRHTPSPSPRRYCHASARIMRRKPSTSSGRVPLPPCTPGLSVDGTNAYETSTSTQRSVQTGRTIHTEQTDRRHLVRQPNEEAHDVDKRRSPCSLNWSSIYIRKNIRSPQINGRAEASGPATPWPSPPAWPAPLQIYPWNRRKRAS